MRDITQVFPNMIIDSQQKEKAIELAQAITSLEKSGEMKIHTAKTIGKTKSDLTNIINKLEIKDDTFVEIRFDLDNKFNLDSVFELQKDELVSQKHTLQTKASIRIVLGTIGEIFKNEQNKN